MLNEQWVRNWGKSMKRFCAAAAFALLAMPSVALADDVTLAARSWYLFDSLSSGDQIGTNGAGDTASFTSETFTVLMKGGSISYRSDDFLPATTFTATGLFGSDTKELTTRGGSVINFPGQTFQQLMFSEQRTPQNLRRRDFEVTAQTRINDLLSWTLGARYERARVRFVSQVTNYASNPFTNKVDVTSVVSTPFSGGYDLFSLRGGVALAAPLNEDRRTLLYANAMGFVGRRENKDRVAAPQYDNASFIGPDVAVGMSHRFAPNIALDIRYRAQFFFSISGSGKFAEPKTTHGPSVGLSYGF